MVKRFDVKTCMMQENNGKYVSFEDYTCMKQEFENFLKLCEPIVKAIAIEGSEKTTIELPIGVWENFCDSYGQFKESTATL